MKHTLILVTLLVVLASPAAAQNASSAGALSLYPTLQNVGVRLAYSGDANLNATARIEWKPIGTTSWKAGASLVRISGSRWVGSVFWLAENTGYDIRAIIDDPDGGGSATGAVTTRGKLPSSPSGTTYWVATSGNDANSGSSGSPKATVQGALNSAQPGDQVRVRAGVYYQTFDTPRCVAM